MAKKGNYNDKDIVYQVHQEFEHATSFTDSINLRRDIKRCVNFEQGNQWNMDDDVKDFPKITLNIIKQIGKVRKSSILQNEYGYLVQTNDLKSVRKIQDFLKHLSEKLKLKAKDLKAVNDTFTKGTGVIYFYWDADKVSFLSKSGGCLRAEVIDIRRFRVADPYIQDLQDQEYVIFVSRERLDSIKAKYGVEVPPTAEDYTHETEKHVTSENPKQDFTNVYTKFYRNDEGQVFFVITTETHLLKSPTALNPFYEGSSKEAPNTMSTMDEIKEKKLAKEVFGMYPFASLVFDERDNSFYGIPGALEIIETQKSINQHFSVYDKGIQDNVLGGFLHKRGVLGEQEITTENGQILQLDLLPGENWQNVFGRIPVNNIPTDALNYSSNLLGVVRQVSGASNVQIGSADYAGQSAKQTQMLLQRAQQNSNDNALIFNEYKKEQAKLMFLFSKFFYDNEDFAVVEHGYMKDNMRTYEGAEKFDGTKYAGKDVMIDIRVGPAPSFSEFSSMELLGMMVQSGQAPLEVYLTNLPDGYVNNKQELLDLIKNNSQQQIQQLQQQLQQAQQVMEQMSKAYQETQKEIGNVDVVVQENMRLKTMIADLSSQAIEKQQMAAKSNLQMQQDLQGILNITAGKQNK
jgi:hypothetical protein